MMKKKRRGRVLLAAVILMLLASCRITDVSEGERKELSYAIVKPGDFPPEIDQILRQEKRIRVPDGVRERGRSLHTARLRKAEKRRLFHTDRRSIEIGKRRFRADKTRRTCRKGGAERHRLLPLRRAENESGGGNLSRI